MRYVLTMTLPLFSIFSGNDVSFVYYSDKQTFNQSQAACLADGLTLAMPDTQAKQELLTTYLNTLWNSGTLATNQIWIGLTDILEEDNFLWIDRREVTWTFWGVDKPDNGGNGPDEDCGTVVFKNAFAWNDRPCSDTNSFVCEGMLSGIYRAIRD